MGRKKKLVRKSEPPAEPPSKRGTAWTGWWTSFRKMTVQDRLQIVGVLLVPLLIALGTWAITWQLARIENKRAAAEQKLAEQRAQDEALQAYLDQMGMLLLKEDLRSSKEDSGVRTLARARTLTVLRRVDKSRKGAVMQFLVEAKLIQTVEEEAEGKTITRDPVIKLGSVSRYIVPGEAQGANLVDLKLITADLSGADLTGVDLSYADLYGTNLNKTDLNNADLSNADLTYVRMRDVYLEDADLSNADLTYAKMRDVYLAYANLTNVKGITAQDLEKQASSLKGATMPNGQQYEEWLKEKKAKGKDEKNK